MPNDMIVGSRIPPPDDAAHADGLLMHDLTVLNTLIGRHVLHHLAADTGDRPSITSAEDRALADRLTTAADALRERADRIEEATP
jgi:hypothetical protein